LNGEEIIFAGQKTGKQYSVRSNKEGKAQFQLPAGDIYAIRLKTMNDTADQSQMEVPALQPGQFFDQPFTLTIEYEPARSFTLDNVHFDTGKPTLRPDSFSELNEIAEYMKYRLDEHYEIAGHTDNAGTEESNRKLSIDRANAVKNYLVKKGIAGSRLQAKGYGATVPVADNSTEDGRQKNRRTEVIIL
jgi:OOP family OmpA-OmpF porin